MTSASILQLLNFEDTGDVMHRLRWPAAQLAKQNPELSILSLAASAVERHELALKADLLFLVQSHDTSLLPIIRERKSKGLITIVEYNDNFYCPPLVSSATRVWSSPEIHKTYQDFMLAADYLVTTCNQLKLLFKKRLGLDAKVLKNHFPYNLEAFEDVFRSPKDVIRIGWAGSLGHMPDLLAFLPKIEELILSNDRFHFWAMGNEAISRYVKLPKEKFVLLPWGNMEQYFSFWKQVDIGISPMLDVPYNQCRSDVKAIEMSAFGVVPVLQDFDMYQEFSQNTGISLVEDFSDIIEKIRNLEADRESLKTLALQAYGYINDKRLGANNLERLEFYNSVLIKNNASNWTFPPGYHEMEGTKQKEDQIYIAIKETEAFLHAKKFNQALKKIQDATDINQDNRDLAVAELKCLLACQSSLAKKRYEFWTKKFPNDFRLKILGLRFMDQEKERAEKFLEVINAVREAGDLEIEARSQTIIGTVAAEIRNSNKFFYKVAEEVLKTYPKAYEIKLLLAQEYERLGNFEQALNYYQEILEAQNIVQMSGNFLMQTDKAYISSWIAALEKRL
ncbi:MAG: hypothetical protein KDD56_09160 [Bdellovibrionales bacterium]|nr:hypothetical protein [Bdellovibrionales bacterium]